MNAFSVPASETGVPSSCSSPGPAAGPAVVGLHTLAVNQPARVVDLAAAEDGDESLLLRLMEIGFLPGELVRIVATGFPGPDPLAVRVGQATFALRRHEASRVLVETGVRT
ncbi:FeoA family protein [Comamonas guangdongensis]|uniref:Ferrous iron transport protein A n=1 Tax=Comamonas guangdongensis TaxID=510515 RepID=A0ABV3ZS76_9BURK